MARYKELENQRHLSFATAVWKRFKEIDGQDRAGVLAFYLILAVLPLLALVGAFEADAGTTGWLMSLTTEELGLSPDVVTRYQSVLVGSDVGGFAARVILIGSFVLFGISAAGVLQKAYARAWRIKDLDVVRRYVRGLAWFCVYFVFVIVQGMTRPGTSGSIRVIAALLSAQIAFAFWFLTPRLLLARRISIRAAMPTAIAGTAMSAGLRIAASYFVPSWIRYYVAPLGLLGLVVAISAWVLVVASAWIGLAVFGAIWWERAANPEDVIESEGLDQFDDDVAASVGGKRH